jgi:rRNA biogenesis protein RRP5
MSLRSGDLSEAMSSLSLSDFSSGQRVDGVIKNIEDYGVFVQIKGTKISGLCHKSEVILTQTYSRIVCDSFF